MTDTTIATARARVRSILHISVGDGSWEPTDQELADVQKLFEEALNNPPENGIPVVATRHGIVAQLLNISGEEENFDDLFGFCEEDGCDEAEQA